jgi:hypothetical protein
MYVAKADHTVQRCRAGSRSMSLAAVLDACTDDTLITIAVALSTPADLLRLALTCRAAAQRFYFTTTSYSAASSSSAVPSSSAAAAAAQHTEIWSLAEEVARRWIITCTNQEHGWVPRRGRESWLGLMWEVQVLRRGAAVFGRSHERITLSEGGALATRDAPKGSFRTAASKAVMRAGRHYTQFTMKFGSVMLFGVMRPGWDVEGEQGVVSADGHCFYYTHSGRRFPGNNDWEGMQTAQKEGDRVGMLLDLDQGSMTVYKNDERLGVMATGLSGEYCWAVSLSLGSSVRIEQAETPTKNIPVPVQ